MWGKAIFDVPGGEEWLNDTIAFAGCYSEAYVTAEPSTSLTLTTTTSSLATSAMPSCAVVSGLAVPQPSGIACGLKGTAHALAGAGTIVGYGAGSIYVASITACRNVCLATACCSNIFFIKGSACNLHFGPTAFDHNVGNTMYDYYDTACFTCGPLLDCPAS